MSLSKEAASSRRTKLEKIYTSHCLLVLWEKNIHFELGTWLSLSLSLFLSLSLSLSLFLSLCIKLQIEHFLDHFPPQRPVVPSKLALQLMSMQGTSQYLHVDERGSIIWTWSRRQHVWRGATRPKPSQCVFSKNCNNYFSFFFSFFLSDAAPTLLLIINNTIMIVTFSINDTINAFLSYIKGSLSSPSPHRHYPHSGPAIII